MNESNKYYAIDTFSIRMFSYFSVKPTIDKLDKDEFCAEVDVRLSNGQLVSALRYESSVKIIEVLCGVKLQPNKISIKLNDGDTLLLILPMIEPGDKDLNNEIIKWLFKKGRIEFYKISL